LPIPSIETLVASVVRHESTTWSPAVMLAGVAVSCAVGAGPDAGAVVLLGVVVFFLQPTKPTAATNKTRQVTTRSLELKVSSP
jgi:hypothetical protein